MASITKLITHTNKLDNALLYPRTSLRKLIRLTRRHLDPNWLARLEQGAEGKVKWVSPQEIRFVSQNKFDANTSGQVIAGDWDDLSIPFAHLEFYRAFVAVVYQIYTWPETPFYRQTLAQLEAGEAAWGCRTEAELQARLRKLDRLFQHVTAVDRLAHHPKDPLSVNIGRHGDMLLNQGEHRLAIAKVLELPRIPVIITGRHPQWVQFKREIMAYTRQQPNGAVYTPLLHPDLAWVPAQRGHERFDFIQKFLLSRGGTMLDIGCNLGYFCHRFEEIGFACTGVELDPALFYFLEKLKRAANKNFQTVNGSIFDYMQQEPGTYDVVLALAVFHHFIKSENMLHQFKGLLAQLDTRELYFQPPHPWDLQMRNAYWNPTPNEFVAFILEHSNLKQATYLGRQSGGRPIYRLTS
ncbi:MAG: class I SAM-dependent methyltransferase [Anaerolineae bacterium]|nr:class I SAM-dependent methyltransferase [Anaerolineae bacterium]